jgi:hypothetical protein
MDYTRIKQGCYAPARIRSFLDEGYPHTLDISLHSHHLMYAGYSNDRWSGGYTMAEQRHGGGGIEVGWGGGVDATQCRVPPQCGISRSPLR